MGCGCGKKGKAKGIVASAKKAKETAEQIIKGWSIYAKGNPDAEVQAIADFRAEICTACPELKASSFWKFMTTQVLKHGKLEINQVKKEVGANQDWDLAGYKCNKCGCAFPAALYVKEKKCPLGKWEKTEKDESF